VLGISQILTAEHAEGEAKIKDKYRPTRGIDLDELYCLRNLQNSGTDSVCINKMRSYRQNVDKTVTSGVRGEG